MHDATTMQTTMQHRYATRSTMHDAAPIYIGAYLHRCAAAPKPAAGRPKYQAERPPARGFTVKERRRFLRKDFEDAIG
jgi:hypothetical protein